MEQRRRKIQLPAFNVTSTVHARFSLVVQIKQIGKLDVFEKRKKKNYTRI